MDYNRYRPARLKIINLTFPNFLKPLFDLERLDYDVKWTLVRICEKENMLAKQLAKDPNEIILRVLCWAQLGLQIHEAFLI